MREIRLVGGIEAVELRDGKLTVTVDGEEMVFPVGAQAQAPQERPERPRRTRQTNGHADGAASESSSAGQSLALPQ